MATKIGEFIGVPYHGEVLSADASSGATFTLYAEGATTTLSVGSSDTVIVSHISMSAGATMQFNVFYGADAAVDAGELIAAGACGITSASQIDLSQMPARCPVGLTPRLDTTASGQVYCVIRGVILRG